MLLSDHINGMGTNPLVGENLEELGPRFPDMSAIYDKRSGSSRRRQPGKLRVPLKEGVYLGLHGPSYETPAEIRAFARLGADAVGMSTVPEAIALRHAGVRVAGISTITNMAAGILPKPLIHEEVLEITKKVGNRFVALLEALVPSIAKTSGEAMKTAARGDSRVGAPPRACARTPSAKRSGFAVGAALEAEDGTIFTADATSRTRPTA